MTIREQLTQTEWPDNRAMHQVLEALLTKVIDPLEKRVAHLEQLLIPAASEDVEVADEETAPPSPSEDPATDTAGSPGPTAMVDPTDPATLETGDPTDPVTQPAVLPVG